MFQGLIALLVVKPDNLMEAIKINNKNVIKDFVVQDEKSLLNDHPLLSLGKASVVNMYKFLSNAEYHPCLGHTISVCNNGDVIPCPMMRNHRLGNTRDKNLYLIFRSNWEKINKFWRLNLDKIEKCIGCEFRYACNDCRALEESLTGRLEGKISCSYNPKVGEWGSMP